MESRWVSCSLFWLRMLRGRWAAGPRQELERIIQVLEKIIQLLERVIQDLEGLLQDLQGLRGRRTEWI